MDSINSFVGSDFFGSPCIMKPIVHNSYPRLMEIEVKTEQQIKGMRQACKTARNVLDEAASFVKVCLFDVVSSGIPLLALNNGVVKLGGLLSDSDDGKTGSTEDAHGSKTRYS